MKILIGLLFVLFLIPLGCGGKGSVKQSEDSLIASRALERIEKLIKAYEEKHEQVLRNITDELLYASNFKSLDFLRAQIQFTPKIVTITDKDIKIRLSWHAIWLVAREKELNKRGVAEFILQSDTMKLINMNGDNPFEVPDTSL